MWKLAGEHAPDADAARPVVIDLDATLVAAHSDNEQLRQRSSGVTASTLWAFVDHGPHGTGEPLAVRLRPGNAGSNTAADHIVVIREALAQLPGHPPGTRPGRRVLVRTDGTHAMLNWLAGQRLLYSVGFGLPDNTADLVALIPKRVWAAALDADGEVRDGAWVAEVTDLLDLSTWPTGMRVIVRKERPHPGAPLRLTDTDGHRLTAFATNTTRPADRRWLPARAASPELTRAGRLLCFRRRTSDARAASSRCRAAPQVCSHEHHRAGFGSAQAAVGCNIGCHYHLS